MMTKSNKTGLASAKRFIRKNWMGYLFLLPFVVLFSIFVVAPVLYAVGLSFTDYNMMQPAKFVGLNNYKLLFLDDEVFLTAISNTLTFAVITGPIGYLLSFFAAWVINQLKFKRGFALAFYAPSITSGIAMSTVWLVIFSSDRYGYLNNILLNLGMIDSPILWNTDPQYIMKVIMIISLWMSMGTGFLVFLAGLQNVSSSYYEAAAIDGVKNKFQELFYITLPLMKPQLLFGAINAIVSSFGVFDIAVSVAGMPSPNYAGHTIVAHLYDYAFIRFQMGYASAVAVVLFVMTFLLGKVVMRLLSSKDE
ncbi:carbohydrate ABC transporter permease [Lachnotalea sp. AF33-28]|jgi:multiple sugar transport system permease protein|uniref:carbohydrate ABC transporter permease n=1 Tax=Lachnotalea sp. AF33-28 TaxID=2292046 RepID=UPI000E46EFBF|nr:sugar ABC transporter permease [Lachnotalea sp. AF33-28]RHP30716.1 sugar ABC transporter permease [Lachnotalea sp. AF33-28]